jgi:hypothetical protein
MKIKIIDHVMVDNPRNMMPVPEENAGLFGPVRVRKSKVPVAKESIRIPMRNPRSANRVTINAFLEAETAESLV